MVHGDLGQQALEAEPAVGRATALAEVFVDDEDPLGRPSQGHGMAAEGTILSRKRLSIVRHLLGGGLSDIDDRQPGQMVRGDLAGELGRTARPGSVGFIGHLLFAGLAGQMSGEEPAEGAEDPLLLLGGEVAPGRSARRFARCRQPRRGGTVGMHDAWPFSSCRVVPLLEPLD